MYYQTKRAPPGLQGYTNITAGKTGPSCYAVLVMNLTFKLQNQTDRSQARALTAANPGTVNSERMQRKRCFLSSTTAKNGVSHHTHNQRYHLQHQS